MPIIHGRNIRILDSAGTAIITAAKSCTIKKKAETIEKSSATSATAREYIAGRTGWEVSLNHLVRTEAPLEGLLKVGQTYMLKIDIGGTIRQGQAICTDATLTAARGSLATGSVAFIGTGELATPTT